MPIPLRHQFPYNEFDHQTLLSALQNYKYPRDRITTLLRHGTIIRVKRGLYILGEYERSGPIQTEILANLIFGPSYISLDYALSFHGLIPERVAAVTSVTSQRSREFATPVGRFVYRQIPLAAYQVGWRRLELDDKRAFLLARPEKALADKLHSANGLLRTQRDIQAHILENLRFDPDALRDLDPALLDDYAERFRSRRIRLLGALVRRLQRRGGGDKSE